MQKMIIISIALISIFSLVACDNKNNPDGATDSLINKEQNQYESGNNKEEISDRREELESYKDINTIEIMPFVIDTSLVEAEILTDEENNNYVKISDDYVLSGDFDKNIENKYFDNQKEILPKKIYLMDDNRKCYYDYNGELYYIPVEKCDTPEEERIEYREYNLVVYRKTNIAKIWGEDINLWKNYEEYYERTGYTDCIMDQLYTTDIAYPNLNKIYEIDLDGDINTIELSIPSYCLEWDGVGIYNTIVSKRNDTKIMKYEIFSNLYGNIGNYRNVFYVWKRFYYVEENILLGYFIFDTENGFQYIDRLANGDKLNDNPEKLREYELTLDEDMEFYKHNCDDYCGHDILGYDLYYSAWYHLDDTEKITLNKGTKIRIFDLLNEEYLDTIIETEDGTKYEIANYAGRT